MFDCRNAISFPKELGLEYLISNRKPYQKLFYETASKNELEQCINEESL